MADDGDDTTYGIKRTKEDIALLQAYTSARILENEERKQAEIDECEEVEGLAAVAEEEPCEEPTSSEPPSPSRRKADTRSVELRVSGLSGELCRVVADPTLRVRDVKSRVASATKMPVGHQRLFLGNLELNDQDVVMDVTPPSSPVADIALLRIDLEFQHSLEMVSRAGMQLAVVPPRLRGDKAITLAAVRQNGASLEFAVDELRGDRDVVMAAVQDCGQALAFANPGLQADYAVVHAAVRQSGTALRYAGPELQADHGLVLAAVRSQGQAFQFASESLREDRAFVLAVVAEAGLALEFASTGLRGDMEIVVTAVRQDGLALEYASEELRAERSVVWEAVEQNGLALWDAAEELKQDPEIVAACNWTRS